MQLILKKVKCHRRQKLILNYNNYIYTVTCSNNKIYTQVYDEKNWNEKYNILNVEESNPIVQLEIIQNGNDIYMFYSGYGYLKIEKMNFNTQQWEDVAKINDILGEFCVTNNSGQFYSRKFSISESSNVISLIPCLAKKQLIFWERLSSPLVQLSAWYFIIPRQIKVSNSLY